MHNYTYTKSAPLNLDAIEQQIKDESLGEVLCGSVLDDDQLTICFEGELTAGDKTTLDGVIAAYTWVPPVPAVDAAALKDGVDPLPTIPGMVGIYVDVNDGQLKAKNSNGDVVVIAVFP